MITDPRTLFALVLALASFALPARAQECAEGRVSSPETAGRCCWPGQSWSEEHGRCSGPPSCPEGLTAEGDRCVLPVLAYPTMPGSYGAPQAPSSDLALDVPPAPDLATTFAPGTSSPLAPGAAGPRAATTWPPSPPDLEHALVDPRIVRRTDETLLLGGLLTLAGGYLSGILFAFVDEAAQNCGNFDRFSSFGPVACGSYPFAFIPFAGGLLSGFTQLSTNTFRTNVALGFALQLPAAMVQILGLVITLIAGFGYAEDAVPAGSVAVGDAEVSIAPYATDSQGGLWLDVRF